MGDQRQSNRCRGDDEGRLILHRAMVLPWRVSLSNDCDGLQLDHQACWPVNGYSVRQILSAMANMATTD